MAILSIIITPETTTDYNNVSVTENILSATIDGKQIALIHSESDTVSDADAKTNFKNKLTELGYQWDSES